MHAPKESSDRLKTSTGADGHGGRLNIEEFRNQMGSRRGSHRQNSVRSCSDGLYARKNKY